MNDHTKYFLDMTFGSGGHTSLLLDAGKARDTPVKVVASDCDGSAFHVAKEMAMRYPTSSLLPVRSRYNLNNGP